MYLLKNLTRLRRVLTITREYNQLIQQKDNKWIRKEIIHKIEESKCNKTKEI